MEYARRPGLVRPGVFRRRVRVTAGRLARLGRVAGRGLLALTAGQHGCGHDQTREDRDESATAGWRADPWASQSHARQATAFHPARTPPQRRQVGLTVAAIQES